MPTASDEDRARMFKYFGDDISEAGPISFLQSHGFVLGKDWLWDLPVPSHNMSDDEIYCVLFLIDEWDFGGIRK